MCVCVFASYCELPLLKNKLFNYLYHLATPRNGDKTSV